MKKLAIAALLLIALSVTAYGGQIPNPIECPPDMECPASTPTDPLTSTDPEGDELTETIAEVVVDVATTILSLI